MVRLPNRWHDGIASHRITTRLTNTVILHVLVCPFQLPQLIAVYSSAHLYVKWSLEASITTG